MGSDSEHVLHFPEIAKTAIDALVENTSACAGVRATLSFKSRTFRRGHMLVPATLSPKDLAVLKRAHKENSDSLRGMFPASPYKPRYLLLAAQEARKNARASIIPADQVARKGMWITPCSPGAPAFGLPRGKEELAPAESTLDVAVAEEEGTDSVSVSPPI